jgi:hypothetical protein
MIVIDAIREQASFRGSEEAGGQVQVSDIRRDRPHRSFEALWQVADAPVAALGFPRELTEVMKHSELRRYEYENKTILESRVWRVNMQ